MPDLATADQIAQLTAFLPGGLVRERLTAEIRDDASEVWQSLFHRSGAESRSRTGRLPLVGKETDTNPSDTSQPLQKVAEGPWRSLGGCLDYTNWKDRERFLELDRAIASAPDYSEPEDEEFLTTAA